MIDVLILYDCLAMVNKFAQITHLHLHCKRDMMSMHIYYPIDT